MKILVLGSGLVGRAIADDLSNRSVLEVTVADISETALGKLRKKPNIHPILADLKDGSVLESLASEFNIAVNAVPGFMGHSTLKSLITAGCHVVDIAFAEEDFLALNDLALSKNVTAVCDIGVAPGMSNLLSAYLVSKLDSAERVVIYVGGLPKERSQPFEYKAVFSPSDLMEEYTRPARFVQDGKLVVKPALTDVEPLYFKGVGTLEAFNSDGLRSLLSTLSVPNMIEKTLRYPGHIQKVEILRQAGFFSTLPVEINGKEIIPADLTGKLLFPPINTEAGEEDITVMKVMAEGWRDNKRIRLSCDLYDSYDKSTGIHSMARTTGYTANAMVNILSEGLLDRKGIIPPEYLAYDEHIVAFILDYLRERNVHYAFSEESI